MVELWTVPGYDSDPDKIALMQSTVRGTGQVRLSEFAWPSGLFYRDRVWGLKDKDTWL